MKVSKAQFEKFKKRCEYWAGFLGLHSWGISYLPGKIDARAITVYSVKNRQATIYLANPWGDPTGVLHEKMIDSLALHEVLHILLGDLAEMASYDCNEAKVQTEEHKVIRTLVKVLIASRIARTR